MAEADINSEAQSESMPVLKSERIYDFKDYTVVITGFACAAWCFITGGTLALYVGVQTALVASIAGNIIAVLLMSLATQVISGKYGVDAYTSVRGVLGGRGTKVFLILMSIFVIACRCGLLASCLEGPGAPEEAQHLRCAGFRHHPDLLVRGGVHELRLGHGSIRGASCAA